jgi:hypothetical protein
MSITQPRTLTSGRQASWQPDPTGRHQYRYFDGARWTNHVADHGQSTKDPYTLPPPPPGPPAPAAAPPDPARATAASQDPTVPIWARPADTSQVRQEEATPDLQAARRNLRGWGITVIVIALPSLMLMDLVSAGIAAGLMITTFLCIAAGIWLLARPSLSAGVVAGLSCVLLGLADIGVAAEIDRFGLAVLFDFVVAAGTFASATRYRQTNDLEPELSHKE